MKKPNLGQKQTCKKCDARFFDLNKNPTVCPKCGEVVKIAKSKIKRIAAVPVEAAVAKTPKVEDAPLAEDMSEALSDDDAVVADDEDDDLEAELEDDQDDDLMEDTSDIGDDTDELSEVFEHIDDGVGDK